MRGTIWRWWAAVASSVLVCLLSIASVACAGNSTTAPHPPAPLLLYWDNSASAGAATPQAAYVLSARFAPCLLPGNETTTAPDQSVTWLVSGRDFGIAYLRATCRDTLRGDYLYRNFLVLVKGAKNLWYEDEFQRRLPFPPEVNPTLPPELQASSLADLFPADTYAELPWWRTSLQVPLAERMWVAVTPRDYVVGLVRDSVIPPPEAITTTVGRLQGWVTEGNGMATVVAPRPDGVVFFFAGTGSASEVEEIAARALPHAEEALGGPLSPATTPTPSQ